MLKYHCCIDVHVNGLVQKLGRTLPPFLATSTVERMAGGISESLLTTGDALEKYQIVAQKVMPLGIAFYTNFQILPHSRLTCARACALLRIQLCKKKN